jgi:TonB family protein
MLAKTIILLLLLHDTTPLHWQDTLYTVSDVNIKPQPEKGMNDFYDRWSRKVTYPETALKNKIQGMVFVQFVVNENGAVSDIAVRSGIGHGCDEAALKGFNEVKGTWKPGTKNNRNVKVKMVIPFAFRIVER